MGDRAVAGFRAKSGDPTIFIYQHWVRGEQSQVLADALQRAEVRWGDDSYATRICLSQMIGEDWNQELSYGVYVGGTSHGADYDYILIVEWDSRVVIVAENENSDNEVARIPFAEFIANPAVSVADVSLDFQQAKNEQWEKRLADLRASKV
jgi:hypothetical protein